MNVRLGENEIFKHVSVLIPRQQIASIPLQVDGWNLSVNVSVVEDGGEPMINIASVNQNLAALTLKNWTNPLGTSMTEVAQLAVTHTGVKVLFLLAHWRVGALDKVEMQFLRRASL